jgi:hypothetical protein
MRLKLLVAVSLLASVLGAGSCIAILAFVFSSSRPFAPPPSLVAAATFLLPAATIIFASVFVYRHTARRRRLQAVLTVLLATVLTLSFFLLATFLSARKEPKEPARPTEPSIAS